MRELAGIVLDTPTPATPRLRGHACVRVDERGTIEDVVDLPGDPPSGAPLIIPGLIDAHLHLPQYPVVARRESSLLPWLERHVFPTEKKFTRSARGPDDLQQEIGSFLDDLAANGITWAIAFGAIWEDTTDLAFDLARRRGQRLALGKVMMDEGSYGTAQPIEARNRSLDETRRLAAKWHGAADGLLEYVASPRFAVTCSMELMRGAAEIAREFGCRIQSHLSENHDEIELVRGRFSDASDYVDVYDKAGLLGAGTLLGHGIHLSRREMERLAETGTTVVHCPTSNFFLNSGICPIDQLRAAGVPLALASDIAGGPEMNPFQVMRSAIEGQKARRFADPSIPEWTPAEAFHLATAGAAQTLGRGGQLGIIDPACEADLVLIDPTALSPSLALSPHTARELQAEDWLSLLVYRATPAAIQATMVRGAWTKAPA